MTRKIIKKGVWKYNTTIPCEVVIVEQNFRVGYDIHDSPEESKKKESGKFYEVIFAKSTTNTKINLDEQNSDYWNTFEKFEDALSYANKTLKNVEWE